MRELIVGDVSVKVPVEKLSKGLFNLHSQDDKKLAVLSFGMLDAMIIESFETEFPEQIRSKFTKENQELFKTRIDDFIKVTKKEIVHGIYKYAKMRV